MRRRGPSSTPGNRGWYGSGSCVADLARRRWSRTLMTDDSSVHASEGVSSIDYVLL